jgi:hypothetical protein
MPAYTMQQLQDGEICENLSEKVYKYFNLQMPYFNDYNSNYESGVGENEFVVTLLHKNKNCTITVAIDLYFNQTANEIQFIEIFGITKSYDCISYGKTTI